MKSGSSMEEKVNVFNPLELLNTVGQEVEAIFAAKGKDAVDFMPMDKLRAKTRFSEKEISRICDILGLGEDLASFIRNFQEDYAIEKKKASESYESSKKAFNRLKGVLPLLGNEFTQGRDRLEDILDFFGVDSEEEVFSNAEDFATLFHSQNNADVDPVMLYAWFRRGELEFFEVDMPQCDDKAFQEWIQQSGLGLGLDKPE